MNVLSQASTRTTCRVDADYELIDMRISTEFTEL